MLNCINFKVWWAIRNLIEQITNWTNQKLRTKLWDTQDFKFEIGEIRDQIEDNWRFDGHLVVQLNKSEIKDQVVKDT